jgi:hypothetical protein
MGGLVDLQLRALNNPSKLACTQAPQGGPIGFKVRASTSTSRNVTI